MLHCIYDADMPIEGNYVPSTAQWVRDQIEQYESSGGQKASTLRETGIPVIIVTMRGASTGDVRKIALMRVEHEGEYALVASMGGAPKDPVWVNNLNADSHVMIQDGPAPFDATVREITGDERSLWWDRSVAVFSNYADYQKKTERVIPIFIASPQT